MDKNYRKKLIDLCVEIYACSELDYEVTLSGNGTNASEAANVASSILNILGIKRNGREIKNMVEKRVQGLREEYGESDDDDDSTGLEDEEEVVIPVTFKPKSEAKKTTLVKKPVDREESEDDYIA